MSRDRWTPPGYYVPTETWDPIKREGFASSDCAHCGAGPLDHSAPNRYCPVAPREVCA